MMVQKLTRESSVGDAGGVRSTSEPSDTIGLRFFLLFKNVGSGLQTTKSSTLWYNNTISTIVCDFVLSLAAFWTLFAAQVLHCQLDNMCACLAFSSCQIWVSTSTFPVSAVSASTSFAICLTSSLHSCTPLWRNASITVMQCSPRHRRRQQTSFSTCWIPLQGSPAIPRNTTKDCHDWCTRIFTGLTFLSESVTNFVYWHIDVSSGRLQSTCRTTAHQ